LQGVLIAKVVTSYSIEVIVKLIDQGNTCRDVHADNIFLGNIIKIFNQRS